MGLVVAVVVICLVILYASAIRKFLGEWFQSWFTAMVFFAVWYWSGIRHDILFSMRGILAVAVCGILVVKLPEIQKGLTWLQSAIMRWQTARNANRLDISSLPDLSPEARLRRQHERGMISDEEFERRMEELRRESKKPRMFSSSKNLGNQ